MKYRRLFIPRIEFILLIAVFWGISAAGPKILNFDGDLPRHLLVGDMILKTGELPLTDIFSYRTTGYPSIPHEWLAQVIFSISYHLLGLGGVVLLTAVIVTTTWAIVYYEAMRRSNGFLASLLMTSLGIGASMIHVLPRPHLFTYLFTALWIATLERMQGNQQKNIWWTLPLLMLFWVNLHGMFVLGMIIWGIYLVGEFFENPAKDTFTKPHVKSMLLGGGLSLLATLFSPTGIKIWEAILKLGSNTYITSRIPEYQSADFHLPETWPFIFLVLLTLTGFARTENKTAWRHIFLIVSFTGIALYTSRMIPLFAIVAVPIAAKTFTEWTRRDHPESRLHLIEKNISQINTSSNGLIWVVIAIVSITLLFKAGKAIDSEGRGNVFDNNFFPVEATTWLQSHLQQGHMFNEFDWGGYLLLTTWPEYQIFMDGHTHIYGEELTREYERVVTLSRGWEDVLEKYQVEWAIVRTGSSISEALKNSEWGIVYQDRTAIILQKNRR